MGYVDQCFNKEFSKVIFKKVLPGIFPSREVSELFDLIRQGRELQFFVVGLG